MKETSEKKEFDQWWMCFGDCEKTMSKDGKDGKDDVSDLCAGYFGGLLLLG